MIDFSIADSLKVIKELRASVVDFFYKSMYLICDYNQIYSALIFCLIRHEHVRIFS